jgi:hypothetical protein
LRVQYDESNISAPIWNATQNQGQDWFYSAVPLKSGFLNKDWRIVLESLPSFNVGPTFNDIISIDDITFSNCNPDDFLRPLKCDFENGFCGWINGYPQSEFNWTRISGSTSSTGTGPVGDQ